MDGGGAELLFSPKQRRYALHRRAAEADEPKDDALDLYPDLFASEIHGVEKVSEGTDELAEELEDADVLVKLSLRAQMEHPYIPQIRASVTLDNEILVEGYGKDWRREKDERVVARGIYYRGQDLQEAREAIERMIEALQERGFEWDGKNFHRDGAKRLTPAALRQRLGRILKARERMAATGIKT